MTRLQADTRLRRKQDLVATDMDGETVMLDIESGKYFALSGVGSHVWKMLEDERTVDQVIGDIESEFDVSNLSGRDEIAADVTDFLQSLVDKDLVRVSN